MDIKSEKEIQDTIDNIIQKSNITTIITAHRKSVIKSCSKCFLIKNGKVSKQLETNEIQKL